MTVTARSSQPRAAAAAAASSAAGSAEAFTACRSQKTSRTKLRQATPLFLFMHSSLGSPLLQWAYVYCNVHRASPYALHLPGCLLPACSRYVGCNCGRTMWVVAWGEYGIHCAACAAIQRCCFDLCHNDTTLQLCFLVGDLAGARLHQELFVMRAHTCLQCLYHCL